MGDAQDVEYPGSQRGGRAPRSSRYSRRWGAVALLAVLICLPLVSRASNSVLARRMTGGTADERGLAAEFDQPTRGPTFAGQPLPLIDSKRGMANLSAAL
jgi:hypothetical protein